MVANIILCLSYSESSVFLATESHDDDGIELYEWEEVKGPLQTNINKDENGNFPNEKVEKSDR